MQAGNFPFFSIHFISTIPIFSTFFLNHHQGRASDFFQDWWAEVTLRAKNGGSFSEMMGPKHIKITTVDIWVVYFAYTLTQTLVCIYVY